MTAYTYTQGTELPMISISHNGDFDALEYDTLQIPL